jgi:biotin carboxylase
MSETKRRPTAILILGGGTMQLPAVRIARRSGWAVYVAALRFERSAEELADRCLEVDVSDREAVEQVARELKEGPGLDGVFTAGTDFSSTVAWAAERLGLPGIPYAAALAATDKSRMRACFRQAGVPSPRFSVARAAAHYVRPRELGYPLVVKPVDNMGARGVRRVDSDGELEAALEGAWAQSRSGLAIVEEYLEGPELSLDAVVSDGKVRICGVADRHISFAPYFVEMGHTLPSALPLGTLAEAQQVFEKGILALGITVGAAKGDIKITPRGAVVGEIAARLSGGYMSGWTYPLASGVEVTEAALRLAVGLPPGELAPRKTHVAAERAFISIPGTIARISGLEAARTVSGVAEVFLRVTEGREVELPINNMGKCGNVVSAAATRREAVEAAEAAVRRILVRLVPATSSTEAFLRGNLQGGHSAFGTPSASLEAALRRMPDLAGPPPGAGRRVVVLSAAEIEEEPLRDWHGMTLRDTLSAACRATGAQAVREPLRGAVTLGAPFWRGVLRGGVQAGVYLIDTLCSGTGVPRGAWSWLAGSS